MKRAASGLVVYGLTILLLGVGCVDREKEKERKGREPVEPSPPKKEEVVITPETRAKVEALLAPARQRELTGPEKEDLLSALVEVGKPGVACLIFDLVEKKEFEDARIVVIEMLGKLHDASAVEVLIEQLRQRREEVRRAAVEALGEIRDLKAVPALIAALEGDKKKRVRAEAATSLGLLRAKEAVIPLIQALDATRETKRWVRRSAAEALGLIGNPQAKDSLMNALNDKEGVVRVAAMFGLHKLGDTRTLGLLEQRAIDTKDTEEEVRQWAVRELGFIGAGQSVQVIVEAMNDTSVVVRVAAAQALGKVPGDESLDALIAGLQDQDAGVRTAVVQSLSGRGAGGVADRGQKLFDALADVIKNEPVESIRKNARALYDLIKPTLLQQPTPTSPDKPTDSPSGGEVPPAEPASRGTLPGKPRRVFLRA